MYVRFTRTLIMNCDHDDDALTPYVNKCAPCLVHQWRRRSRYDKYLKFTTQMCCEHQIFIECTERYGVTTYGNLDHCNERT